MADSKEILCCPACHEEMAKIFVENANLNIDICDNCGGILFDNRELEKFDDKDLNADEIFEALKGKDFKPVDEEKQRICPVCQAPMARQGAGTANVKIDVCYTCGAKFLDNGELEKIRNCENKDVFFDKLSKTIDKLVENSLSSKNYDINTSENFIKEVKKKL